MIAEKLNVSRRTIFNWKKKYKWDNHIVKIKDFSNQFTTEIYSVDAKILSKLNDDLGNNRVLNKHSICALAEITKIITKNERKQNFAPINFSNNKKYRENFTTDFIHQIQKDILSWNGTY